MRNFIQLTMITKKCGCFNFFFSNISKVTNTHFNTYFLLEELFNIPYDVCASSRVYNTKITFCSVQLDFN